jgi:tetratricopeptide (TPR) repeat protein
MRPFCARLLTLVLPIWLALCCAAPGFSQVDYHHISHDAVTLYQQRNFAGAASLLESGLASATRENNLPWEAVMLGLLGPVYQSAGKFMQAEDALNRSIDDWTRAAGPDAPALVGPLGNLGELYSNAGQPSRAEKLLLRAISIESEHGSAPDVNARLLTNLGNAYFLEHKDELAEEAANEALKNIARMKEEKPDTSGVYSLLGAVCFRAGRLAEAESWLKQSLRLRESALPADDPLVADSVANLASFYSHSGQPEKARPLFERAARIYDTSGGDNRFIRNFYGIYAEFERASGHRKEARVLARRADRLWNESSAKALSSQIVDVTALENAK